MKQVIMIFFSLFLVAAYAQERTGSGPKPEEGGPSSRACPSLTTNSLVGGFPTATDLVEEILGPGISYSNVSYTGAERAAGFFDGGIDAGIGIISGIMLSSGRISNAIGPNEETNISENFDLAGDSDLDLLASPDVTFDACVLEFDFDAGDHDSIFVQFVFGSEEYMEYIDDYNDVFAFYLNGVNIALVPVSPFDPVSINTINNIDNSAYFKWNDDRTPPYTYCNEMDGFTVVITAKGELDDELTNQHVKLAIADTKDRIYDAWVFIRTAGFSINEEDSDLEIEKEVSPPPYYFGNNITFTITVTNNGPDEATGIEVTELLPSGYAYVSSVASKGAYSTITDVWDGFDLADAESATLTIVATILESGDYENIVEITGMEQNDPNGENNSDNIIIEPAIAPSTPLSNWAILIGIGLIVAFMVIRFRRVL